MSQEQLTTIYNFLPISESLVTAGQPTEEEFPLLHKAGYEIVVNLALPTSTNALPDERSVVEAAGMTYVPIPVQWETPTLSDLEQFFQVLQTSGDRKIFVHCAMNMRVSAFVYLYRRIYEKTDAAIALADLHRIWEPNPTWQAFIEQALAHYQA